MSIAAPQAAAFYREVAVSKVVWAISDAGGFPAPIAGAGSRSMPFWSSESRALKVIQDVAAYKDFKAVPIAWTTFCERWVPGLIKDGLLAGVNWSGSSALGYDVEPDQLRKNVEALFE